jgi:MFS family permease
MSENRRTVNPLLLGLFWLGIQAVWGAMLGISLQSRTIELVPRNPLVSYGHLATWGALVAAVVQIVIGPWSDRRRRGGSRRVEFYAAGAIGGAVAIAFFYQARSFEALTIAFLALQLGMNVANGPYQAIIPDFVSRDRFGIASSWMAALQSIGNAVGALCASVMNDARMLAGALDALLLGTCAATWAHVRTLVPTASAEAAPLRITRAFVDLFISRALVYVGFFTLVGYLLFYVSGVLGASSDSAAKLQSGILILAFTIIGALGAAFAARPTDRMDKRLVATIGGSTVAIALVVFIVAHTFAFAAVATAIAGLGWGVFLVADWSIACRILPPGALATTMGLWNLALIVPQIVAPAFTTAVLQRFSLTAATVGPRAAFALAIGETLVGIAWLWRLPLTALGE